MKKQLWHLTGWLANMLEKKVINLLCDPPQFKRIVCYVYCDWKISLFCQRPEFVSGEIWENSNVNYLRINRNGELVLDLDTSSMSYTLFLVFRMQIGSQRSWDSAVSVILFSKLSMISWRWERIMHLQNSIRSHHQALFIFQGLW